MYPVDQRRRAAFGWAALPVWLVALPVAAWGYLAAGMGGQDVAFFAWFVQLCQITTPWTPEGFRVTWLAGYLLLLGLCVGPTLSGAVGPARFVRTHARSALRSLLLLTPMLLSVPYAMGVVARLPDHFSLVAVDGSLVSSDAGNAARRAAAWIFAALLLAAPVAGGWRDAVAKAWSGAPPSVPTRGQRIYWIVASVLGVMMVLGAKYMPV